MAFFPLRTASKLPPCRLTGSAAHAPSSNRGTSASSLAIVMIRAEGTSRESTELHVDSDHGDMDKGHVLNISKKEAQGKVGINPLSNACCNVATLHAVSDVDAAPSRAKRYTPDRSWQNHGHSHRRGFRHQMSTTRPGKTR
jgi:hypothetical protein